MANHSNGNGLFTGYFAIVYYSIIKTTAILKTLHLADSVKFGGKPLLSSPLVSPLATVL